MQHTAIGGRSGPYRSRKRSCREKWKKSESYQRTPASDQREAMCS